VALRAFLDLPNAMSVRIGPAGLLVGRHRSCDLQLADESASRRHALLRVTPDGVELVVLGRRPVHVGDRECTGAEAVRHGDLLRFPGLAGTIRVESFEETVRIDFCIRHGRERFQIHATPFIVGGGPTANVVIAGWPDETLRFRIAQGVLHVEAITSDALCDGAPLEPEVATSLPIGAVISYRGTELGIEQAEPGDASTVLDAASPYPRRVLLEPLPRGGRVTFTFADGEHAVYLPGRRFRLVSALVDPPPPHVAGEFVPDHVIVPVVWNDDDLVGGRQEINVLLTRCRQDLVAAGIAATKLLERAPGGRATRIALAAGAEIKHAAGDHDR
jgi:hypothetical protein